VKLIIDIPELDYECAKQRWMRGGMVLEKDYCISKGTPLDDIKAEIQAKEMVETDVARQFYNMALADAIQILDNIGKVESGDEK